MLSEEQIEAIRKVAGDIQIENSREVHPEDAAAPRLENEPADNGNKQNRATDSTPRRRATDKAGGAVLCDAATPSDTAKIVPQPHALTPARSSIEAERDNHWAVENLRFIGERPFNDMANVLRIIIRHPDFIGRFQFNTAMGKVIECGTVLMGWQVDELSAVIQERFLPEVTPETVLRAITIAANRNTGVRPE